MLHLLLASLDNWILHYIFIKVQQNSKLLNQFNAEPILEILILPKADQREVRDKLGLSSAKALQN